MILADVQLEHGFTRIANDILERMARIKLSPTQYRILFLVWRCTYGFQKKEHDMSLTFISEGTGCDRRQIQRELKGLEDKNIIIQKVKHGSYRKISFNKDFSQWSTVGETTIGEIAIGETNNTTVGEIINTTVGETDNQKRKYKENIKIKVEEDIHVNRILEILEKSEILESKNITAFLRDDISDVIDNFGFDDPEEMIIAAIKEAARGNGKTWLYVYKKLVAWKKKGYKTPEDLEKGETTDGKTIQQHHRSPGRPTNQSKEPFNVFGNKVGRY